MGYVTGLFRMVAGTAKLGTVLVQEGFAKKSAVKKFRQVLLEQGLPEEVVNRLTQEYADMLSLNPLSYARGFRLRRGTL